MPEPDIWGTTRKLIEIYGPNALATAASRAERLIAKGDGRGSRRWDEIAKAVQQLLNRPVQGSSQHRAQISNGDVYEVRSFPSVEE
jgi:hypothetical protein